jgi:four helix bundle protein
MEERRVFGHRYSLPPAAAVTRYSRQGEPLTLSGRRALLMLGATVVNNTWREECLVTKFTFMGATAESIGSKTAIRSFEDLDCWKAGRDLRLFVQREVLPRLPKEEHYRLGDQMLRAARSVTANLAEGYGRFHYLDNSKFCSNARGSCSEVLDHLITAGDEGMISHELLNDGRLKVGRALQLINGYMAYLRRAGSVAEAAPLANPK